jgi:hypothetical protein
VGKQNPAASNKENQALKITAEQIETMLDELNIKDARLKTDLRVYCQQLVKESKRDLSLVRLREIAIAFSDGFHAHEELIMKSAPEIRSFVLKSERDQKVARLIELWGKDKEK